jgi:enediyne biosynthesis protein CalE5
METKAIIQADRTDQLRAHLHAVWGSVAGGWREHADWVDNRGTAMTAEMLHLTAPRPGERVLELACGAGGLGLLAAELVGPRGEVVVSDVAPEMTAIAAERANAAGLSNVGVRELDLERIDEPDRSYDVVLCREGLMLVPDPVRAAREIRRVLRPGGRAAITVWGPQERNPWLGIVLDVVTAQLGAPVPPPGIPGPFSLDDADRFAEVLSEAGLSEVRVDELSMPYHATSFEDWWTRTAALAGPLAQMLAALPEPVADELHARAREAVNGYRSPNGLDIPGVSLVGGARRG